MIQLPHMPPSLSGIVLLFNDAMQCMPLSSIAYKKQKCHSQHHIPQCTPTKSIVIHGDGRIRVSWALPFAWDGDIYISEDGKSIIQDTFWPKDLVFNPAKHFEHDGVFDMNDVYFSLLSLERKTTYLRFLNKNPTARRGRTNPSGAVLIRETVFKFPFALKNKFQDRVGSPESGVLIDTIVKMGDWAVGYLQREAPDEHLICTERVHRRRPAFDGTPINTGTRSREEGSFGVPSPHDIRNQRSRGEQYFDGDAVFAEAYQSPRAGGPCDPRYVPIPEEVNN